MGSGFLEFSRLKLSYLNFALHDRITTFLWIFLIMIPLKADVAS